MSAAGDAPLTYTLGDERGLQVTLMDVGATWLACAVPMADGNRREVLLGHATPADHGREPGYLGACIGRHANRIANATFEIDGHAHRVDANEGRHHLHGGGGGFHARRWRLVERGERQLSLALHSPAGEQGYPGALDAEVLYRIDGMALTIAFEAAVDAACPVCLTNHAYFNLDATQSRVVDHRLRVAAHHMLPTDAELIPTGELAAVAGTAFDLRAGARIGERLGADEQQRLAGGYDHCYALDDDAARGSVAAAELTSSDARLTMRLTTNYPGLQVYSGNHLAKARGRDGEPFAPHAGIALEPQFFPNSPNQPAWRSQGCILRPGQRLQRWMRYEFAATA